MSNKKRTSSRSWRNNISYINQYEIENTAPAYDKRRKPLKHCYDCQKLVCVKKNDTQTLSAIVFSSGNVKIGKDVWRLSNPSEYCEYYVRVFKSIEEAKKEYDFFEAPASKLPELMAEENNTDISGRREAAWTT